MRQTKKQVIKKQVAWVLTVTPDDANFGPEIVGIYKTEQRAYNELGRIIKHYVRYNEAYDVCWEDAINYYRPEIKRYVIE